MNSEIVNESVKSAPVLKMPAANIDTRIGKIYLTFLNRVPKPEELENVKRRFAGYDDQTKAL